MTRARLLLRWIAIFCVFVLGLELSARVDDYLTWGAPPWARYDSDVLRATGVDGVPRNVPGARFEKWQINSLGFRGPEVEREKSPGQHRIMVLGQSESFGLYESEGGEWPEQLRRTTNTDRTAVEVINASVVGTGRSTRQEYFDRYLLPLQPDLLILVPNVFSEASTDMARVEAVGRHSTPEPSGQGPIMSLQMRVLPKLSQKLKEALPAKPVAALQLWRLERKIRKLEENVPGGVHPLDHVPGAVIASYEGTLRRLVDHVRSRGVVVVLATYPTMVHANNRDEHRHPLLSQRVYHLEFSEEGLLDVAARYNEATRSVARELSVPLVDLSKALPGTTEYFVDQVHYTDKGAQLVAERVLEQLLDSKLIEKPN
jgi:hypothetical protein